MKELPKSASDTESIKDWCAALILLLGASAFFLALRLSGRAFVVPEFETLVIYLPSAVCLLIYATMMRRRVRGSSMRRLPAAAP